MTKTQVILEQLKKRMGEPVSLNVVNDRDMERQTIEVFYPDAKVMIVSPLMPPPPSRRDPRDRRGA